MNDFLSPAMNDVLAEKEHPQDDELREPLAELFNRTVNRTSEGRSESISEAVKLAEEYAESRVKEAQIKELARSMGVALDQNAIGVARVLADRIGALEANTDINPAPEYDLHYCEACNQMTNHLSGVCQKHGTRSKGAK